MDEITLTSCEGVSEHLDEIQVLDVREGFEWAEGRIEGSVHIPLNDVLGGSTEGLTMERPVVVVCSGGNRSELAAMMLRAKGFEAHNLENGLREWDAKGLPLTTPEGTPGRCA